jgi:adenylate cyclase class 2
MAEAPQHTSGGDHDASPPREEREIKVRVEDAPGLRELLQAEGAELEEALSLEDDRLFDDENGSLAASDQVLRLRRKGAEHGTGRAILTYKGAATVEDGARVREEIETLVGEPEELVAILQRLGFAKTFRYQKRRELLRLGGALLALDETPLGHFLEIEGSAAAISDVAERLGLRREDFLSDSYPSLWRREHGEPTKDMVFDESDQSPEERLP